MRDNTIEAFFALVRTGLWGEADANLNLNANDNLFEGVEWEKIYQLAQEQSVQGLVLAGLEQYKNLNVNLEVNQKLLLQWIGEVQVIEQRNKAMNVYIAELIEEMRLEGIYTLLVKGQGLAQCYNRPNWRSSGDVDLLLSKDNYEKAKAFILPKGVLTEPDEDGRKHLAMKVGQWAVELHGTLRVGLSAGMDRMLDKVQYDIFCGGQVRFWIDGQTQVFLPAADEDVVFVFAHILQHFYKEGIGLRQICDWCRLLWTYKDSLNHKLLETRIKSMGVLAEWKAFAALAVNYIGMPVDAMPFYSDDKKWKRKAVRVMEFVLETGNFGHNRDYSYQKKYPYIIYKAISFWKHLKDGAFFFSIFQLDSIKVTWRRMVVGVSVVIRGKRHE